MNAFEIERRMDAGERLPAWVMMESFILSHNNDSPEPKGTDDKTYEKWYYCPDCQQNWTKKLGAQRKDKTGKYLGTYDNIHYTLLARKSKYSHKLCKRCRIRRKNYGR